MARLTTILASSLLLFSLVGCASKRIETKPTLPPMPQDMAPGLERCVNSTTCEQCMEDLYWEVSHRWTIPLQPGNVVRAMKDLCSRGGGGGGTPNCQPCPPDCDDCPNEPGCPCIIDDDDEVVPNLRDAALKFVPEPYELTKVELDKRFVSAYFLANAADLYTTYRVFRGGGYEMNPVLKIAGDDKEQVLATAATFKLGYYFLVRHLHKHDKITHKQSNWLLGIPTIADVGVSIHNMGEY